MKATATEALSPHCEPQWPHNLDQSGWASRLQEAASGASTLFRLIHADLNLAEARAWDDNPETLPAPFTADVAFGLRMALRVCLGEVQSIADALGEMEITKKQEA
ncbi:hypothetical protein CO610_01540 [Lysobacteraceae bacterium NML95-0200]|nr:hypothetical protein CO610_01540 [Xanthomonadaceae bacterium NML95-0200]